MYEEVFKSTKPFQRCLVSSTLQKYCRKQGKTIPFPQLPRKTHDFGKNRAFLGKNKKPTRSARKNKKKSYNINKKARKYPHFPASLFPTLFPINCCIWEKSGLSWEKSRHYWEKSHVSWENGNLVKNIVHAPHALKGQKLLAQGNRPG